MDFEHTLSIRIERNGRFRREQTLRAPKQYINHTLSRRNPWTNRPRFLEFILVFLIASSFVHRIRWVTRRGRAEFRKGVYAYSFPLRLRLTPSDFTGPLHTTTTRTRRIQHVDRLAILRQRENTTVTICKKCSQWMRKMVVA